MKSILGEFEYEANLEDWKEEGLEEGRAQGIAQGRAEGRAEERAKIAAALKNAGIDIDEILMPGT